ncbi:hypothetical protein F66182_8150 [Fusarium sp. NRRL 66182]|nr:hypothetical protein F66182_8150 [Fusarium sp. NRRL 66182]
MTVFFVDWDLWQEMTFVLGCCIVLVFAIGLFKLWWSNRAMRRHEIIDEEKRARVSLMSHCGIDAMRAPEIPFGVRAIQSGIEVEGIWISGLNTPESCQLTPGAALVGRSIEISKGKGDMIELNSSECLPESLDFEIIPNHLPCISGTPQQRDPPLTTGYSEQHVEPGQNIEEAHLNPNTYHPVQEDCRHDFLKPSNRSESFSTPAQLPTAHPLSHMSFVGREREHLGNHHQAASHGSVCRQEDRVGSSIAAKDSQIRDSKAAVKIIKQLARKLIPAFPFHKMAPQIVHDIAAKGFNDAQSYDTHRPSYPPAAVSKLLEHLDLEGQSGHRVLDLAAGTGKFTELLAARPEEYEIIAVEPLDSMRSNLAAKKLPKVEVRPGTAADMKFVEDGWAGGCIVAQAFHWFAKEEALKEIHRVLKPGSKLGMIWNVEDYNRPETWPASTEWEQKLSELNFNEKVDEEPRFRHLIWKKVFERQAEVDKPLFSTPIETGEIKWSVWLSPEALWDRMNTLSWNAIRQGEERRLFRDKFDKIVNEDEERFNEKGEVEVHGRTFFAWTSRLDGPEGS